MVKLKFTALIMTDGIYLLLGSNLGDRRKMLADAEKLIDKLAGKIIKHSAIYKTEAWGNTAQPAFLNQVFEIKSKLTPKKLLITLQQIEENLGRIRHEKWGARVIDIDIIYFGNLIYQDEKLSIPHPEISSRRFTLVPLVEISPYFVNPQLQKTNIKMLADCKDELTVKNINFALADIK